VALSIRRPIEAYAVDGLGGPKDLDYFAITVDRKGRLEIVVDNVPANVRFDGRLLDGNGQRLRGTAHACGANRGATLRIGYDVEPGRYLLELDPATQDRRPHGLDEVGDNALRPYRIAATLVVPTRRTDHLLGGRDSAAAKLQRDDREQRRHEHAEVDREDPVGAWARLGRGGVDDTAGQDGERHGRESLVPEVGQRAASHRCPASGTTSKLHIPAIIAVTARGQSRTRCRR
jgi:hypothetical protein